MRVVGPVPRHPAEHQRGHFLGRDAEIGRVPLEKPQRDLGPHHRPADQRAVEIPPNYPASHRFILAPCLLLQKTTSLAPHSGRATSSHPTGGRRTVPPDTSLSRTHPSDSL